MLAQTATFLIPVFFTAKAVLVNISRGHVVEEESLYNALVDGIIRAAVIDTWWCYPTSPSDAAVKGTKSLPVRPSKYPFHELAAKGKASQP